MCHKKTFWSNYVRQLLPLQIWEHTQKGAYWGDEFCVSNLSYTLHQARNGQFDARAER